MSRGFYEMASLNPIDRWVSDLHNTDDCAVCGCALGFRSASSFCSPRCNNIAQDIRQYCRTALTSYTDLEFGLSFIEGVYPTLTLPACLQQYYPGKAQRIYPVMPMELQSKMQIVLPLIEGLARELGVAVIKEIAFAENLWGADFAQKRKCFERGLYTRMFLQSGTFICPDCNGKWFDGNLTRIGDAATCCEPVQMKMPF